LFLKQPKRSLQGFEKNKEPGRPARGFLFAKGSLTGICNPSAIFCSMTDKEPGRPARGFLFAKGSLTGICNPSRITKAENRTYFLIHLGGAFQKEPWESVHRFPEHSKYQRNG
jgi:hypothetical protein